MSEIAAKVGGSKGTLYNYFRSKEELFAAFMQDTCNAQTAIYFDPLTPIGVGKSVRESLIELGVSLLQFLLIGDILAVHRLVVAEGGRFPELGRMFFETGPQRGEARFTETFREAMAAGHLPPGDPRMTGQRYKDLVMSDVYMRQLWGVLGDFGPAKLRAHVAESAGRIPPGLRANGRRLEALGAHIAASTGRVTASEARSMSMIFISRPRARLTRLLMIVPSAQPQISAASS